MSSYKILVDIEEENGNELPENKNKLKVKEELICVETTAQVKKVKWMSPSKRSKFKKFKKLIFLTLFVGFIAFFVLLYCFVIGQKKSACSPQHLPLKEKWNLTVTGIDINTKFSLTFKNSKERGLAFGYISTHKTNDSGVMMLNGNSGSIVWKQSLFSTPSQVNCQSIDANKDGNIDCLATGPRGLMTCLNSISGKPLWYVHTHGIQPIPVSMSSPLVTRSDFTDDGVPELLSLVTTTGGQRYLMFVCGMSGIILGDLLPFPSWCSLVTSPIQLVYKSPKSYLAISCITNTTGEIWLANIEELYEAVQKPSIQTVHEPLFHNIFQCNEPATQISLFTDVDLPTVVAACNNGEVGAIEVTQRKVSWRTVLPYFTHSRVMGAEPSFMNNKLITLWSEANETESMIVVFSMRSGKIEWKYLPPKGVIISTVFPFYSRKYKRKFEILMKTSRCDDIKWKKPYVTCHCTESFVIFDPAKRNKKNIMEVDRFFNSSQKCRILLERTITSAVVGDMLGDNSKQTVIAKRWESAALHHSETYNFDMTLIMVGIKSPDHC